jgi:polysaccharide export outer membrane protein
VKEVINAKEEIMTRRLPGVARLSVLACLALFAAHAAIAQQPQPSAGSHAAPGAQQATSLATGGETTAADSRRSSAPSQYRIGPLDVLAVRVTAPDIVAQFSSEAVEVSECGTIPLLSVQNVERSEIRAAGLTTLELQEQLRKFYTKYKRNPQVVVRVKEYNAQPVAVNGAVVRPGQFQMRRPVRLSELVRRFAGGPTERSGGTIQVARIPQLGACEANAGAAAADDAPSFLMFKLDSTLAGEEKSDPLLQPGDVVTLPDAKEAYVVGNVLRPGPVVLKDDHLTVSRAIAMSGGLMPDTKNNKVRIIRQDAEGQKQQEIYVDLTAINKHKAEDIALKANDIVDVPTSGGKRLLRSLVGTIAPSVGQLPVRIIP